MRFRFFVLFTILAGPAFSSKQTLQENPVNLPDAARPFVQLTDATVLDRDHARNLILQTLVTVPEKSLTKNEVDDPGFYCIIHVARWADSTAGKVDKQNWYVYRGGRVTTPETGPPKFSNAWTLDDLQSNRLYGTKGFWLLYVHANAAGQYMAEYDSAVTTKIRANLANLFALTKVFTSLPNPSAGPAGPPENVFGGGFFQASVPSDIAISAKKLPVEGAAPAAPQVIADSQKFDNEGKYYLDFSVGVPITKVTQLSFDATKNTVSPTAASARKALALIDLHVPPIDVKSPGFTWIPYLVSGFSIQKQPLHQIFLGAGWGPQFANFFVGALWVKQPGVSPGTGQGANKSYEPQFAFGVNITVSSFTNLSK